MLKQFAILIMLPGIALAIYVNHNFNLTLPKDEGVVAFSALTEKVNIIRDEKGVAHIYAKTDADAFFAMGYVHAQDRMWQLEVQRRTGSGRLSEIFGYSSLRIDKLTRTLGLYRAAKASWDVLQAEAKNSLTSYTKGVNAWINEGNPLPIEYSILGFEPEQWAVYDSLTVMKLLGLDLAGNLGKEIDRYLLTQELNSDMASELFSNYPHNAPSTVSAENKGKNNTAALYSVKTLLQEIKMNLRIGGKAIGSNAWVISGQHTKSGLPVLANDLHLGSKIPSIFYLAEINGDRIHSTGATIPGLPMVIFGYNQSISWGGTNMMADTQDLYIERVIPHNPNQYEVDGQIYDMQVFEEEIIVKADFPEFLREKNKPLRWKVRNTHRGPVISDVDSYLDQVVSLQWSALSTDDASFGALLNLNYANNWAEFKESMKGFFSPPLNYMYADIHGNIGYLAAGKIPLRKKGNGSFPVPGWKSEYGWSGWVPFENTINVLNPDKGFIINANNRIIDDNLSYHITYDWEPPYRAQRIEQLIEEKIKSGNKISVQEIIEIQADQLSIGAQQILPLLLDYQGNNERQVAALGYLKNWDSNARRNSVATTIYHAWIRNLKYMILQDDLKGDLLSINRADNLNKFIPYLETSLVYKFISDKDSRWCDIISSAERESCEVIKGMALNQALDELEKLLGNDMDDWLWGDAHTTKYIHTPFSEVKLLDKLFERKISNGGSEDTVNLAPSTYSEPDGYEQFVYPAYREIIDLANLDKSVFMVSPGQSGNVFSEHYDDLMELHRDVKFLPMRLNNKEIEGKKLVLTPVSLEAGL